MFQEKKKATTKKKIHFSNLSSSLGLLCSFLMSYWLAFDKSKGLLHNFKDFSGIQRTFAALLTCWRKNGYDSTSINPIQHCHSISTKFLIIIIWGKFKNLKRPFISGLSFAAVLLMSCVLADQTSFQGVLGELNLFVCFRPPMRCKQSEVGSDSYPCMDSQKPASQKLGWESSLTPSCLNYSPSSQEKRTGCLDGIFSCCISNGRPVLWYA